MIQHGAPRQPGKETQNVALCKPWLLETLKEREALIKTPDTSMESIPELSLQSRETC